MNWRPLIGSYEVSDEGQIRNVRTRRVLKWKTLRPWGYRYVILSVNSRKRTCYVHRAVLEAFVGPCPEGLQARHLNGDRDDNRVENLAWGTPLENAADTIRHGRVARGGRLPQTRLTIEDVRMIRRSTMSAKELAEQLGVARETVGRIRRGQNWRWVDA